MEIKKFISLEELLLSDEFKNKNLSYCDLSGIDLSGLSYKTWLEFIFDHTNFSGTNIVFRPWELKRYKFGPDYFDRCYKLEYCDFTDSDLSYLNPTSLDGVSIKGSNFTNTNLNVRLLTGYNEEVSSWSWEKRKDYSDVTFPQNEQMYGDILKISDLGNCRMIKNNPFIDFDSLVIFKLLKKEIPSFSGYISDRNKMQIIEIINDMIGEDNKKEGHIMELFNILNPDNSFNDIDFIRFFQGIVENKNFGELDFSNIPPYLLREVQFINCSFKKIVFPEKIEKFVWLLDNCSTPKVYFPSIAIDSWENFYGNRLFSSRITFYRNLYLELGRSCNGSCKFCRNQYLEPCNYDINNIINNLSKITKCLDNVVIGGGEPTLFYDDLFEINRVTRYHNAKCVIFTNASIELDKLITLSKEGRFSFNISRHSISDDINNQILGVNSISTDELEILNKKTDEKITLCATCFKGDGLDTVDKLEDYIVYSDELNIDSVMFQTLHKDLNSDIEMPVLSIEEEVFDEMIIKLKEQGYKISIPIYSTADYKLITAKKGDKTISFKRYISKEELEKEWYFACKRSFDLSMDPSGNVYENWHQSSGKVLIK